MSWWTLTYLDNNRTFHHLSVLAGTNHPAHLWMAWARYAPARQPIYRNVRGKRVFCGYKYIWDTPNLVEQDQALDTFQHTFGKLTLASTDHVWYFLYSTKKLYDRYCQSPLIHVPPPEAHTWTTKAYVGTQLKGIYYTDSFTGPGGDHPTWTMANFGLHSTHIWQLEPDPLGLAYRLYALAGDPGDRILYERIPAFWPTWAPLLTDAQAIALTGSTTGTLCWIATNTYFPGYLYVMFNSGLGETGSWCLRSEDYGETWSAHVIYAGILNANAGNIMAGIAQGDSPHDPGTTLYAALNHSILYPTLLYLSLTHGDSWQLKASQGIGQLVPRCLVDPTDQSTVYIGALLDAMNVHELFRSEEHGANLVHVDGDDHLGIMISPARHELWVNPTAQELATALASNHLFTTPDYCVTWTDHGATAQNVARLAILWENPDRLYLARYTSGTPGPPAANCHVLFASEDYGATMYGKAGAYSCDPTGHGDSIPYNCGGVCLQGIQLFPPY